ncbi:MAG: response regulator [Myxococcales bacterium]|nr:response regulator [Myxococcales bacterium]
MSTVPVESVWRVRQAIGALERAARRASAEQVAADLLKMVRAADTLLTLLEELPQRLAEARGAEGRRMLRHSLRTPLNQIVGYSELIAEEAEDRGDDRWSEALRSILADGRELLAQVDRLGVKALVVDAKTESTPKASQSGGWDALSRPIDVSDSGERPGTILVVDDNRSNRELLERRLRRDGFEVLTAEHGSRALEVVRAQPVDVVLLDIIMPVMDGYQTLEQLKADPDLRHLPVIMLTSLDEPESITRCVERGAEDHLPKPFDAVLLRARIGSSLERKRVRDRERRYLARIVAEKRRADDLLHGVIPIGVALSGERDLNRLLERLLEEARRFCGADGGVLFLQHDDRLEPVQLQCASLRLHSGSAGDPVDFPSVDLGRDPGTPRPSARAALSGATINLSDVRDAPGLDLGAVEDFDRRHDYVTRSLIALPLRAVEGELVGVLELWNATRATDGETIPFDGGMVDVLESLSRLAGVALVGYRRETELRQRIRHLEIRIDEANRRREVSQITETDYFRKLRDMAQKIRATAEPSTDR